MQQEQMTVYNFKNHRLQHFEPSLDVQSQNERILLEFTLNWNDEGHSTG